MVEDETARLGYLSLEEIHSAQIEFLRAFSEYCATKGLRLSLGVGTLLGMVRYKGFIPWGDDADVAMPKKDYEEMLACQEEISRPYGLITPFESGFSLLFSKFVYWGIKVRQRCQLLGSYDEYLWADIFPMDGVSDDELFAGAMHRRMRRAALNSMRVDVVNSDHSLWKRVFN